MEKTKTRYRVIEPTNIPATKLLVVPHKGRDLTVSYPAFGPDYFANNIREMKKSYIHPLSRNVISFREPTTSESISVAAYGFGSDGEVDAKRNIFDPHLLQLGYIVRTSEGVFTNIDETDEKWLKLVLNRAEKVNGIYLINDFAFVPYDTFKPGVQDHGDFAESGLARALENTKGKTAKNLREIASPKFYKKGVNVRGFDSVKKPILRVAGLDSGRFCGGDILDVCDDDRGDYGGGFAFGVLK